MICPCTDKICTDPDCKQDGCLIEREEEGEEGQTVEHRERD